MMRWIKNSDQFELATAIGLAAMVFIFIVSSLGASDIYPTLTNRSWNGVASWAQPVIASGASLPAVGSAATGDLFVLTTGPTIYRLQGGAWNAMSSGAGASSAIAISTKSATYTVAISDAFLLASTTTAFSFILPPAASATGLVFDFKKISTDTNYLYIIATQSQTIDGETTKYTNVPYANLTIISNGANWFIR